MRGSVALRRPTGGLDAAARVAERMLRIAADPRLGLLLLLAAAAANALATILPGGRGWLASAPYLILLGAVLLTGMAAVAVRTPAAWREWRRPGPLPAPSAAHGKLIATSAEADAAAAERVATALRRGGYRARVRAGRRGWAVHATQRGWSRFASLASHLAVVLVVIGAGLSGALAEEQAFSLLAGEQAVLDGPGAGAAAALRLESFEADFGSDGRPRRLDTTVTFLTAGEVVRRDVLRVNEPGSFDGRLIHAWTYGPAARLRATDLSGRALLDAGVPLDGTQAGAPGAFVELPAQAVTLGVRLEDAAANRLRVTAAGATGTLDSVVLAPGETRRVGPVEVTLSGMEAYVGFLARSDPGMPVVAAGGALLVATLAVAAYAPRRRASVVLVGRAVEIGLRGDRFERPAAELARISGLVRAAL